MALAALAPLLGSLAGGSLGAAGFLGPLGALGGAAIGSGLGTTAATGDVGKGLESGLLGYGLGGAMGAFGGFGGGSGAAMNPAAISGDASLQGVGPMADLGSSAAGANTAVQAAGAGLPANSTVIPQGYNAVGMGQNGMLMLQRAAAPSAISGALTGIIPGAEVAAPGLSLTGEALQPAPPVTPTYTSPGLTPYKPRTAAAIQTNYLPGTGPEINYFNPSTGYAAGGAVSAQSSPDIMALNQMFPGLMPQQNQMGMDRPGLHMGGYDAGQGSTRPGLDMGGARPGLSMTPGGGQMPMMNPLAGSTLANLNINGPMMAGGGPVMAATAMNLTPQQIMQQQLLRQQQAPNGYAGGGSVMGGKNLVDSRGLSFLNHEAMKQAMPMSMGAQGTPGGMNPNMGAKLPKFAAGGMPMAPGMQGIADPSAGDMAVPPIAGDGMSDSIPATIDGKQPALLSSNEHVIPADAVSALGNGSSAAGHKALKSMVKRVRIAKTGKASQPPAINPANYLPA